MKDVCIVCHWVYLTFKQGWDETQTLVFHGDSAKTVVCMAVMCMIALLFAPVWTRQDNIILLLIPVDDRACNEGLYKLLILYDY